jgi:hypothetical protein
MSGNDYTSTESFSGVGPHCRAVKERECLPHCATISYSPSLLPKARGIISRRYRFKPFRQAAKFHPSRLSWCNFAESYIVPAAGDANTYATTTSDATSFPL